MNKCYSNIPNHWEKRKTKQQQQLNGIPSHEKGSAQNWGGKKFYQNKRQSNDVGSTYRI